MLEPIVEIKINGKKHEMKPTFKALSTIEREIGIGLLGYLTTKCVKNDIPIIDCVSIISNGIKGAGGDIDVEKLGDFVYKNLIYSITKCAEFIKISFYPEDEDEKEDGDREDSDDVKKK